MILMGRHLLLTMDVWTSLANVDYVTCAAHFIDPASWKQHSIVMGLFEKNGGCENQLTLLYLSYIVKLLVLSKIQRLL
jgi:hypothetical protein